ncbi:MAG: acetylornithine/N-succinyldiaminopimelate aminotransferase [Alphaproteobacteria bacterium]
MCIYYRALRKYLKNEFYKVNMSPLMKVYNPYKVNFVHGEGVYLYDDTGKRYIDCVSGIAVNAFGHNHPVMVKAVTEQLNKIWHVSNLYVTDPQINFAQNLCDHTFAECVFIGNSGAEAIEAALKTARSYFFAKGQPQKTRIISFSGAFHGRTHLCMTASGMTHEKGLGHIPDDFDIVPFGDHDALKAAITDKTAAILIEPIQGESGIRVVPHKCLEGLRSLCDTYGILLIFDEIQCGAGRTGKLFAYQHTNITPDIMAIAKGIGGGFPVGACLSTQEAAIGMVAGTHGSTYGGNPLASVAGNTALCLLLEEGFLPRVCDMGSYLLQALNNLKETFPNLITQVKGKGLLIGVALSESVNIQHLISNCLEAGLSIAPAAHNTIRFLPPLIITQSEIDEAIDIFQNQLLKVQIKS